MASTFSPNLRLELIGTGDQQGTWGATTNTNLGTLLEEAIGGYISVTVSNVADTTLTASNGAADQSRNMVINLVGTITATRNVICPAVEKLYVVKNATTGGFAITFKVSGQTGVTVPNGSTVFIYVDGTDARAITGSIASQAANSVTITGGSITGITDLAIADGGTGASDAATARTNLGLGTISTQNSNAVSITGGSISGITDLAVADGGTGASNASDARTNLGLGTIATQNANSVSITGGSISGITDLAVADGGTGASDAATARTNLGLGTIATQNASTVTITGGSISGITDLAIADGGTGASDAATARTNLGLAIGTNVQAYDATLQSLSALGTAADRLAYTTGVDTWAESTITAAGRAILDDADAAAQRTTLGLGALATLSTVGTSQIDNNSVNGAKIALGSDAQGDIMYYNGTDWARLAAGTSGQFLKTQGAGANPAWDAVTTGGMTLLGTITTTSGTSLSLTGLTLTNYKSLVLVWNGVSTGSSGAYQINDGTSDYLICTDFNSASSSYYGQIDISLDSGAFYSYGYSATNSSTYGSSTSLSSANFDGAKSAWGRTRFSTASTAVTVKSTGFAFDAGSILVYGVR